MTKTNFEKVKEFHKKYNNVSSPKIPTFIPPQEALLRVRLMNEELSEVIKAMSLKDMLNLAKELADLLYVVYGTADRCGINIDKVFEEVHFSNMTKSKSKDAGGKVIKGPDYIPTNIEKVLKHARNL